MSSTKTHNFATRLPRRVACASVALFTILAVAACDTGSLIPGVGGTVTPDAGLRSLTVSSGTLTPVFDSATTSYSLAVTAATTSITVSATAKASGSSVTVNGALVASGGTSPSIPLAVGSTTIVATVTASDGVTVRAYSILAVRPAF